MAGAYFDDAVAAARDEQLVVAVVHETRERSDVRITQSMQHALALEAVRVHADIEQYPQLIAVGHQLQLKHLSA